MRTPLAYDAVVVGAGPYGLSTAAHLRGRGLKVAVFGKPLGMWREHMPRRMLLRSHWWATNLSDPDREFGFARFCRESKNKNDYPVPLEVFVEYGLWFQQRAVPDVDETFVSSIARQRDQFHLTLADGREVQTKAVVMAIGPHPYANRLPECNGLRAGLVSHSSDHNDFGRFKGQDVIVMSMPHCFMKREPPSRLWPGGASCGCPLTGSIFARFGNGLSLRTRASRPAGATGFWITCPISFTSSRKNGKTPTTATTNRVRLTG